MTDETQNTETTESESTIADAENVNAPGSNEGADVAPSEDQPGTTTETVDDPGSSEIDETETVEDDGEDSDDEESEKVEPQGKTPLEKLMATSGLPKMGATAVIENMNDDELSKLDEDPHEAYNVYTFRVQQEARDAKAVTDDDTEESLNGESENQ